MIIIEAFAVAAVSTVVASTKLLKPLRDHFTPESFIGTWLRCGFCQSFWWAVPIVVWRDGGPLEWLAISFLSGIMWMVADLTMMEIERRK